MATIQRFEDLEVWKLARELASDIFNATLIGTFANDNDLKWQIRKSSGSVMDNIAEGFERGGKKGIHPVSWNSQRICRGG